jgi:serine/threonine-protein kinase
MALEAGTRLGVFEIRGLVGAGGMGEVYRATDSKLGRSVAIKVLPDPVARDADCIARFRGEARALAALHHPHIASLFGMEEADNRHFLVMELVEGETLAERLTRMKQLPRAEALGIARQIAEGLEAAHDKGIVHRDLKPANIKITPDDKVKLLDFGLAKALVPDLAGENAAHGDSLTRSATDTTGIILGTAAYMSPEQARGKAVDRRTDIWAFGCVLYEMLSGKRAFPSGESLSDVIAAVLTREVAWDALPPDTPPHVRTLLRRCLQKDLRSRLPHIGVARLEIDEDPATVTVPSLSPVPRTMPLGTRAAWLAIVAVVGLLSAIGAWTFKPPAVPTVTRFSMTLPDGKEFTNTGRQAIALSPDGLHIVYCADRRLFARALWDEEPREITGTSFYEGVMNPVFSPDGRSLAFVSGTELKRVAFAGGTPATVAPISGGVFGMSWVGDDLFFGDGGTRIARVSVSGGTPEVLVSVDKPEGVSSPVLLPDGEHLLFSHAKLTNPAERWTKAQVVVQSLKTGERKVVVEAGADGRYLASGHLVYAVGGVVYGARFDLDRLALSETPAPLIEGVRRGGPTGAAQFAVSASGSLAYLPGTPASPLDLELFLTAPTGKAVRLNVRGGQYEQPRLSPDGKFVAFGSLERQLGSVFVYELSGASAMRRLTVEGSNRYPVWSGDGERIVFQSNREGDLALFWQRSDGTGGAERLTRPDKGTAHVPASASPDGRHLLYSVMNGNEASLWLYSFQDRRAEQLPGVKSSVPIGATFSPNGRFIAYHSNVEGEDIARSRTIVSPFPPNGTKYDVPGGMHPMWSADGRRLFSPRTPSRMGVVALNTEPTFTFGEVEVVTLPATGVTGAQAPRGFDIGRDGTMVGIVTAGDLVAVGSDREIRVVLNWLEELKRQAAAP